MFEAQMVANDAAYYYLARSGRVTDWPVWWVFDNGDTPLTAADVADHFGARAELLEPLRRRVQEVPGGLGHPFWVVDDRPIDTHLVTHAAAQLDWAQCQDEIGHILAQPLDARVSAWQLHVFPNVAGIPTPSGFGTVVLMHLSHALMAGPAMTSLSEALFAAMPLRIEGQGPATQRPHPALAAVAGVLRWPLQALRFNVRVRREMRRIARENDNGGPNMPPVTATRLNRRIGPGRVIRTIPLELSVVRASGVSVTAVGLTAISRAMQRYLETRDGSCPEDLAALVTVALPASPMLGVNFVGGAAVALAATEPDLAARARTVDATLRVNRHSPSARRELNRLTLIDLLPSRTYRTRFGTLAPADPDAPAYGHTILTSVRCDPTVEWSLSGKPFRFTGGLPPMYPEIGLAHSFIGAGDTFTVSVGCDPDIVPDLDDYFDILRESCHEVAVALR
ncbi:wax ester/triacylglycerol synthase domain-containing protein [Nocardia sp. R16R-3T]